MRKTGYNSYRGRRSSGRSALAVTLALLLAGACAVLFLQRYIVYSDDGRIYYTKDHYETFILLYGSEK